MEIDFSMIEPTAQWLELIAGGASETVTKEFFLAKVAPTAGCQSIVKHWARFRPDWDALAVHAFFMEADRHPARPKARLRGLARLP